MDFGRESVGGGIDPSTGFSRRSLFTYTGYAFDRILPTSRINYLMNIQNFCAALVEGVIESYEGPKEQTSVDDDSFIFKVILVVWVAVVGFLLWKKLDLSPLVNKQTTRLTLPVELAPSLS